uniref:hypothetical protein n=1 Tax=Pseudomonas asiatica TaxID=2219225 RepID=UPI0010BFF4A4
MQQQSQNPNLSLVIPIAQSKTNQDLVAFALGIPSANMVLKSHTSSQTTVLVEPTKAEDKAMDSEHTEPVEAEDHVVKEELASIEQRMERRIDRLADEFRREMRLRDQSSRREAIAYKQAVAAHLESNDKSVSATLAAVERAESEFQVKQANKELRFWMAGIGVAIVLGIMGANATIFGGGKAFFDGGKEALANQQRIDAIIKQAQEQTEANRRILDEIRAAQLKNRPSQSRYG